MSNVIYKMSDVEKKNTSQEKVVAFKRKGKKNRNKDKENQLTGVELDLFNRDTVISRTSEAKNIIKDADYYQCIKAALREVIKQENQEIKFVCIGLGRAGESITSRYQLALLLCLTELYNSRKIEAYDPLFTLDDHNVLNALGITPLTSNCEGKYTVNEFTIFYMPHCPKQLTNNLLWANWGLDLYKCVIIGNSFVNILESNTKSDLSRHAEFILKISPYVVEIPIINSFKFSDIFNDFSIHFFPFDTLKLICKDFWEICEEPEYLLNDLEYIRKID